MIKDSIQKKLRERFYCTPKSGLQFSGVLINSCRRYLTFADVEVYPAEGHPEKVKGDLYIEKANVAYCQLMPHVDG